MAQENAYRSSTTGLGQSAKMKKCFFNDCIMKVKILLSVFMGMIFFCYARCGEPQKQVAKTSAEERPVIYSSDLFIPRDDPDDHFDLVTLFSLKNLDIKAVVLDNTMKDNVLRTKVDKKPNYNVVKKVAGLFGRANVPAEAGLAEPLSSVNDKGLDRPEEEQKAIELIISQLKTVKENSATIITTGSLRDVCAAFNREPDLFRAKIKKIMISIGDSYGIAGITDTNVSKDIEAWKGIMASGLPVDWLPCNPSKLRGGPSPFVSYWYFMQPELMEKCPLKVQNFFDSEEIRVKSVVARHMWSTPAFIETAGLKCYKIGTQVKWMAAQERENTPHAELCEPYSFVPISFALDEKGAAVWAPAKPQEKTNIRIFQVNDYYLYNISMFQFLADQFNTSN
jgi:hypothetical protein